MGASHKDDLNARLSAHLRAGGYQVGDRLPAERELAQVLEVGRTALRPILDGLRAQGVVERRPQAGTFLLRMPAMRAPGGRLVLLAPFDGGREAQAAWLHRVASAFERAARAAGASLQLIDQSPFVDDPCSIKELAGRAACEGAGAVVMLHPAGTRETIGCALALLHDKNVHPLILSARTYPGLASQIYFDGGWGVYGATRHLIERGHRRIGFAGASRGHEWVRERELGWAQALDAAELPRHAQWTQMPDDGERLATRADGAAALEAFLSLPLSERPTGIVAANDIVALGVLEAARARGLAAPRDFSLIGFDNEPDALLAGLSTLERPTEALGEAAARVALEQLAQGAQIAAVSHRLRPQLIERATVGPPPASIRDG